MSHGGMCTCKCPVLREEEKVIVSCPVKSGLTGKKFNPSTFQTRFSGCPHKHSDISS